MLELIVSVLELIVPNRQKNLKKPLKNLHVHLKNFKLVSHTLLQITIDNVLELEKATEKFSPDNAKMFLNT